SSRFGCRSAISFETREERTQPLRESNCVNRAIGVPAMILHDFEDAGALSSPGLSARVFTAKLRYAERGAYLVLHWFWESQQIIFAGTHPKYRPFARNPLWSGHSIIPVLGYNRQAISKLCRKIICYARPIRG